MVGLLVAAVKIEPLRVRLLSMAAGREDSSNNFRINVWLAALEMIHDRPWLGIGPGNSIFNLIYPLYQQPRFTALSAYSVPLELAVETGIPGLLAALGLLFTSVRIGFSQLYRDLFFSLPCIGAMAAVLGLAGHGLVDTIFFRPEVQITGWFLLATLGAGQNND